MLRTFVLIVAAFVAPVQSAADSFFTGTISLGNPDAKVYVDEFTGYTSTYSQQYAIDFFPTLKERYIDTGQVFWRSHEFYGNRIDLWASLVVRCQGVATVNSHRLSTFEKLRSVMRSEEVREAQGTEGLENVAAQRLFQYGLDLGISQPQLQDCWSSSKNAQSLVETHRTNLGTLEASFGFDGSAPVPDLPVLSVNGKIVYLTPKTPDRRNMLIQTIDAAIAESR